METPEQRARLGRWIGPFLGGVLVWGGCAWLLQVATPLGGLGAVMGATALIALGVGLGVALLRRSQARRIQARWPLPTVPVALVAVNPDGRIANLNRAAELVLGWGVADARGHRIEMLVPGIGLQGQSQVLRSLRGTAMGSTWGCRARHRDGSSVEVRVAATFEPPGQGQVYLIHEVGGREPAAVEAREARARLIEELATEIRAPLNMVSASCALALSDANLDTQPALKGDLERIRGICGRLQALTCDLVDLARLQSGAVPIRPEDVPLDRLLHEVMAQPGAQVEVEGEVGVIIRTDPQRLRRILFHLVGGGRSPGPTPPAQIEVGTANGMVQITVSGVPARESGVGAELVTGLTELLGGSLVVGSELTFRLELPLDAGWGPERFDGEAITVPFSADEGQGRRSAAS